MGEGGGPLAFHATPPPGQWINDPNALLHANGAYRLFVQHRRDAPAFRETGWARLSSPDLLRWTFDGAVIPPDGEDWAYSGSVYASGGALTAVHTLHTAGSERQVRRSSTDAGANWSGAEVLPDLGDPARNRRDPFVFHDGDGWALLLAEPCDWTEWRAEPASQLRLYRSHDGRTWREAGIIGPWHPPGVMWEVPLLARVDGRDVLFVSTVDRRGDGATCAVRAWVGAIVESGFVPDPDAPAEGQLLDFGPDFYAIMMSAEGAWPGAERQCFVAWAGSWATGRNIDWPGFYGGPITLPRTLAVEVRSTGLWLAHRPIPSASAEFNRAVADIPIAGAATVAIDSGADVVKLTIAGPSQSLHVRFDLVHGVADMDRRGAPTARWSAQQRFTPVARRPRTLLLYLDSSLIELFLIEDGVAVTVALDCGNSPFAADLSIDGKIAPLVWRTLGL